MNKLILLIFLACCLSHSTTAQTTKPNYALLWEISGKDFQGKSYLFGTMHLRDERVFELCDSVMVCIEDCKAFAMEVHPDSVLSYVLDHEMHGDSSDQIGAMIDSLGRRFEYADNEMEWDSLLLKQPEFIKNILKGFKEVVNSPKRPQVLDLTLFGYAKGREKSLYGLERLQDYKDMAQAYFQQNQSDKNASMLAEGLVNVYRSGDLDALKALFDRGTMDKDLREEMFGNRNLRMVARMKALGAEHATFFAMGAGHLPGDDGVIALLRKEGYTVRKVKATFTGVADSLLKANAPTASDIVFSDPVAGFTMRVPSKPFIKPISVPTDDGQIIKGYANIAMDLNQGYDFTAATMVYPASLVFHDKREVFKIVDKEYQSIFGPRIGEPEDVYIDRHAGKRMRYKMGSSIVQIQLMMRGNRFFAFASTRQALESDLPCRRFFESIRILPPVFLPLNPVDLPQTDSKIAFPDIYSSEFDTSAQIYHKYPEDNSATFTSMDTVSTTQYLLIEHNWSKYFTVSDSFFNRFKKDLVEKEYEALSDTLFHSMPAFWLKVNNIDGQYFAQHLIIPTDNGSSEMIVISPEPGHDAQAWAFFNSYETPRTWTGKRKTNVYKKQIFADLLSPDSLTVSRASYALTRTELGMEDVPEVLDILNQPMPEDTLDWGSVHQRLWSAIDEIKDERIVPFAETYFKANSTRPDRQELALKALLAQNQPAAIDAFFRIAPEVDSLQSTGDYSFSILYPYIDSALVASSLPRLMRLREHPSFNHVIIWAISDLFQRSPDIQPMLIPYGPVLVKDVRNLIQQNNLLPFKDTLPEFQQHSTLWYYIHLLGYVAKTDGSADLLKKFIGIPDASLCGAVVNSLMRLGETVDVNTLKKWHKMPGRWYEILSSLDEKAYLDNIPAKLLDVETFIEGAVPGLLFDYEYIDLKEFKIIEKRKYSHQGQSLQLYVFTYRNNAEEGPDNVHLGLCGLPENGKLEMNPPIFSSSYEPYDGKNKDLLVEQLLSELE